MSKCFRLCHPSPGQRGALGWHWGMCCPCSCAAIRLPPAPLHSHPQCHLPTAPALTGQSHPAKAAASPQPQQQPRHTPTQLLAHRAASQAAPPGTAERKGWGKQQMGVAETGKAGRGHFFFFGQNTLVPFQHHPQPSPPSGLQLGLLALLPSVPGGLAAPPRGIFVKDTSGWGGGGQGVRHDGGGGQECSPLRRFPKMGWGVGHPSMSQLKRWCFTSMSCTPSFSGFFSFSCRTTQRAGSVPCTQKRGGCACGQIPSMPRSPTPRQSSLLHFPPLHSWTRERLCGSESAREEGGLPFPSAPAGHGQAAPSASTATQLMHRACPGRDSGPIHSLQWLKRTQRMGWSKKLGEGSRSEARGWGREWEMPRTHLPLYWQLPVLREAEGKFTEDSAMEDSDGNTHTNPIPCPQAHNCAGSSACPSTSLSLQGWKSLFVGVERAAPTTHPLFLSPLWASDPGRLGREAWRSDSSATPTEPDRAAQGGPGSAASPQTNMAEDCTQLAMGALQVPLQKADPCQ